MDGRPRLGKRWWAYVALVLLACLLAVTPVSAQLATPDSGGRAPVVVDGRVVFRVNGTENNSAIERASQINSQLSQEVKQPELAEIEVVQAEGLVYLRSLYSGETLITITDKDVLSPGSQSNSQAERWAEELETALRQGQLERRPAYLREATFYSLLFLAGAIAIHLLLRLLDRLGNRFLHRWLTPRNNFVPPWARPMQVLWHLALLGLTAGLWLTTSFYITDVFPQVRSWRYTTVNFLTAEIIELGGDQYSALELLLLLGLTVGLWFAARLVSQLFRRYLLSQARIETRLQDILSILVQYVSIFLGAIILLQIWGINASSLAILASLLGVGIGFGVQNITNNFISGFIITLERPIEVGDFVNIGDLVGIVKRIGARSTEINTLDQVTIIVPNSRFLESEVINWSHGNPVSRLHVPVGVAYNSDINEVKRALLEAVKLLRPEPEVWFQGFGDSALNFEIMVWTGEPRKQARVLSDLNYAIEASLRASKIEIPFPQQDFHLRSPQLEEIIGLLKRQSLGKSSGDVSQLSLEDQQQENTSSEPENTEPPSGSILSAVDLEGLAIAMQADSNLPRREYQHKGESFTDCFYGSDAVRWLETQRQYTTAGAIYLGQRLLQRGLILGVGHQDRFDNGDALYRFYQAADMQPLEQ